MAERHAAAAVLALTVGAGAENYCAPHDFRRRDLPKLYLIDQSYGHSVEIFAGKKLIWRGVFEPSGHAPNIQPVGIPPSCRQHCTLRVSGGPYWATLDVSWTRGTAILVHFLPDRVVTRQLEEPVYFQ